MNDFSKKLTYDSILRKLNNIDNFSMSRWGDGEWNAVFSPKAGQKKNCDGTPYYKSLGLELFKVIKKEQRYHMGMQSLGFRQRKDDNEFKRLTDHVEWFDADIIHHASIEGRIPEFFKALSGRKIVWVANEMLDGLFVKYPEFLQGDWSKINIAQSTAWENVGVITDRLLKTVKANDVVIYCAGMMSNHLIDFMYSIWNNNITQIDMGSALDPYAGEKTRRYHYNLKV